MESRDAEMWIVEGIDSRIIKIIMQINVVSIELNWNWIKNLDKWHSSEYLPRAAVFWGVDAASFHWMPSTSVMAQEEGCSQVMKSLDV